MNWLEEIREANGRFKEKVDIDVLPTERQPCPYAILTCMDPRINLEAAGIKPFKCSGELKSQVRVIRTLGGISEDRSLVVGIHLAGFKEIAVVMHTDCGCSLAHSKIDTLIKNMQSNLSPEKWEGFKKFVGDPLRDRLREWLHAFEDPRKAVRKEVEAIKDHSFAPESLVVHGLVYDLSSGAIEVVINGYES